MILFAIGVPVAVWLAYTSSRIRPVVEAVVALPLVLPPTVLGFYLLLLLGPNGPVGRVWGGVFDARLAFTFEGLLIGSIIFSLPFAVQPFTAAFSSVDRNLIEASWCLGHSRLATFFRVILPVSFRGVVAGLVLAFAHTLGEFGVALMIGGNIEGVTRVASIAIYEDVQTLEYGRAARTSIFLVSVSFVVLLLTHLLQSKPSGGRVWARR